VSTCWAIRCAGVWKSGVAVLDLCLYWSGPLTVGDAVAFSETRRVLALNLMYMYSVLITLVADTHNFMYPS
jgi:hypothetical protein